MGYLRCCVNNCANNTKNCSYKFYCFPTAKHKLAQRTKWIAAVRKQNGHESNWNPKPSTFICSAHFIGNKKGEEAMSPSYIPTKFSLSDMKTHVNEKSAVERHKRFMERRMQSQKRSRDLGNSLDYSINTKPSDIISDASIANASDTCDQECQADIFVLCDKFEKTFNCNRYIYGGNTYCDAEIQTEISELTGALVINNTKKFKNKGCGTAQKVTFDKAVGTNSAVDGKVNGIHFHGSVTSDEQLTELAGISFDHFYFLMKKFDVTETIKVSKEVRLLIFLFKMKFGLTFSAISAIFSVHRTTISRIFNSVLENLTKATAHLVFWPDRQSVQATMPDIFKPQYADTRVIIDCTEFRIDVPSAVDDRVNCYSHYKKGFTGKVLIGITPGGYISFKSLAAGGRKSDSQITIESGLVDMLQDGDVVLANKGFPEIKTTLDNAGKKVILVMPPFLGKKSQFSKEETEETHNVAKVRMHVERIMQRLRTYQILHKIPEHLFDHIDDIIHMCCVLVNLHYNPLLLQLVNKK